MGADVTNVAAGSYDGAGLDATSTPFGRWGDVDAADLGAFFASANDEGLTWEAKGPGVRSEHVIRAGSGFANSVLGGVLVLGAERRRDAWALPGVQLPGEPSVWVAQALRRLMPTPAFDVRVFDRGDVAPMVLILVRPVPTPPCLTPDGQAFERTTGATEPVRDPTSLARLFVRGDTARQAATRAADAAATSLFHRSGIARDLIAGVAMAATGYRLPLPAALFRQSYADALAAAATAVGRVGVVSFATRQFRVGQEELSAWTDDAVREPRGAVNARADGSVAVARVYQPESPFEPDTGQELLTNCWNHAADLLRKLGGYGQTRIIVATQLRDHATVYVRRWATHPEPAPDSTDILSVLREVRRARGDTAWEPEADAQRGRSV